MRIDDYLCAITDCETTEALTDCLVEAFSQLGATALSGQTLVAGVTPNDREWKPIFSTFPASVSSLYWGETGGTDSFKEAVLALGVPVRFVEMASKMIWSSPDTVFIDTLIVNGIRDGVSTPVFASPGVFGYFTCAFPEVRDDLTRNDLRRIQILFTEYYIRYRQLTQADSISLSRREHDVLSAVVQNKSTVEISAELGVSEHTVNTYIRRCFEKLNASSRVEAALKYVSLGLALQQAR